MTALDYPGGRLPETSPYLFDAGSAFVLAAYTAVGEAFSTAPSRTCSGET